MQQGQLDVLVAVICACMPACILVDGAVRRLPDVMLLAPCQRVVLHRLCSRGGLSSELAEAEASGKRLGVLISDLYNACSLATAGSRRSPAGWLDCWPAQQSPAVEQLFQQRAMLAAVVLFLSANQQL